MIPHVRIHFLDLSLYDYWEPFDPTKTYEPFEADFGKGVHSYTWKILIFCDTKYAIVRRDVSDEYLKLLTPYCQCIICTSYKNVWSSVWKCGIRKTVQTILNRTSLCRSCVGCLRSGTTFYAEEVLAYTEKTINDM